MRILVISIVATVAFCMAVLVFVAGIRPGATGLVSLSLGLLMLAALFAAIAALGPKFSPSPTLTPTMAGVLTVLFVTVAIAASSQTGPRQPATDAATASEFVPAGRPAIDFEAATSPAPRVASVLPDVKPTSPPVSEPGLSQPVPATSPYPLASSPYPLASPEIPTVFFSSDAPMAIPATSQPASEPSMAAPTTAPVPPIRPADPFAPLVATETATMPTAPPVPRSRPCGGAWPACP